MRWAAVQIQEGEKPPWWYGVAYFDCPSDCIVCYPVPLNILARWIRAVWWALQRGKPDALARAYDKGYRKGIGEHRDAVETINRLVKQNPYLR